MNTLALFFLASASLLPQAVSFSVIKTPNARTLVDTRAGVALSSSSREILTDIDMMCIVNAVGLCDYYDECDIDQREAFLNRLDEQTDILTERLATLTCVKQHLNSAAEGTLNDEEVELLKGKIIDVVNSDNDTLLGP